MQNLQHGVGGAAAVVNEVTKGQRAWGTEQRTGHKTLNKALYGSLQENARWEAGRERVCPGSQEGRPSSERE